MHCFFNTFLCVFLTYSFFKPDTITACNHAASHKLVIIQKPVADLFEMIPDFFDVNSVGAAPEKKICPRDHQGIYNEAFCLILEQEKFYNLISSHVKDIRNKEIHFKMKKEDGILINSDHPLAQAIPVFNQEKIITLLFPWRGYSIGTQFVAESFELADQHYSLLIPNFEKSTITKDTIPEMMTTKSLKSHDPKMRFVECVHAIIQNTLGLANYTIPYVWGGASFIPNHNDHPFYLNLDDRNWHIDRIDKTLPYSGFDCSGLIWRVLTMLGQIDHPWRNTQEMVKKLKKIERYSELHNGDLLWCPGHIAIITDKETGEIIEARGYASGYGKIHQTKLETLFENIKDFETLFRYKKNRKNIYLKSQNHAINKQSVAIWACLSIVQSEK